MEFGAATATLSKKLSNGYGVSGRSAYDGVFATPIKLKAPSFSSRFEDYREIFGGSEASLGSSIPILELPELNERKKMDDIRRSKFDYSKVFGGFGNLDTALPLEELLAEHKQKDSFSKGASARNKAKEGNQSCREDPVNYSKEIPPALREASTFNDTKRINMSYHKVNQGSENGTNGTTRIAQLHAVSTYTCLVEEVSPVKMNRANRSIPVAQDANSGIHCNEQIKEGGHHSKSFLGPSSDSLKKQSSNGGVKVKSRSDSIDLLFDACEISNESDGKHHIKVPPSETVVGNLDNHNGDFMRSMATKCHLSKNYTSEGAAGAGSPSYLDDIVDSNSEAAASLAALRKAIEEAQVRINVAKESMRRKKEGFPDRVKRKSNKDLKAEGNKETKLAYKTMKLEENNMWQTFGEMDALPQVSSKIGKPMMKVEQVRSDLGAKEMFADTEVVREAQKKLKSTQAEHKEQVELKEGDQKTKILEHKEADNNKKVLDTINTGRNAFENPEDSDQTAEVVKGDGEQEDNEKVCAGNEAGGCKELADETKHRCQELVDETKLVQETPDNGTTDIRLEVKEDGEVENKVTRYHEPEDSERKQGEQGLTIESENKVACKTEENEKKVEGSFDLEECQRRVGAPQEPREAEKNIAQEQKGSEESVEVFSELEGCELTEFLEPVDKERACNPHSSDLKIMRREIENLACVEDEKRRNEGGFLDIDQEIEHSCQREGAENMFSNIYVQEILEEIVDHVHDGEEIYESITKDSELDGNMRVQGAKESENELERATHLMEENERGRKDNKEPVEVIRVTETGSNYEEIKANEAGKTTEISSNYEPDETEKRSKIQVADTIIENDETLEETPEVYAHDVQDDSMVASDASFQHQEKCEEQESVEETNDFWEKHAPETSNFTQGALELNEAVNEMQNTNEEVIFEGSATNIDETDVMVRQNQDQHLETAENDCYLAMLVEEPTLESVEICMDAKEARNALNEEIDENRSNFSDEENLFENEHNIEASQIPSMSEWKSSPFEEEQVKTIHTNRKENHQASLAMEEQEANDASQKVELEKEHLKKIDEAKEREREREKEKLAVERAIREARERAFADARERAALERAAAEARQKNISDGRERLGKSTGQATDKTLAEKAAMEAKLKAERAAVERATAEARARALERALSEKAASEARNKSEKCFGVSRDNGMKQNFYSKSFSHGEVRDSIDEFDGTSGDSAQRCKARSERHQRIGERVAKALAEKNTRDRLVQKEQEERNRVAEALDADVKRWSNGKTGNLRALLSTLQYILGPDSGWQPIPLTDIVTTTAVKKAYRKATLFVHPDKLQQRGASIQQKYTCEKVFDLLKEAWNRFNMEER